MSPHETPWRAQNQPGDSAPRSHHSTDLSMRIVCLSDTHNQHRNLDVPPGDILIHAGDSTFQGTLSEVSGFLRWINYLPHPHKILIAGNHDWLF